MICANGCFTDITPEQSSSITCRELAGGLVLHEHRHLDCRRRATDADMPPGAVSIPAES